MTKLKDVKIGLVEFGVIAGAMSILTGVQAFNHQNRINNLNRIIDEERKKGYEMSAKITELKCKIIEQGGQQ